MELLQRAGRDDDLQAWAAFQPIIEETVLIWLHEHPDQEAACRLHHERHFVVLAFERLRQVTVQRQLACMPLSEVLVTLRACLNGAILETMRVSSAPATLANVWPDEDDHPEKMAVWNRLQARLSCERERRLAYLLYHCGLSPAEIVRGAPQEWSDAQEVAHLRSNILLRLMERSEL